MSDFHFTVIQVDWETHKNSLKEIRSKVFIEEQSIPEQEEWDEYDPECRHVLAMDMEEQAIGTGRLTREGKIGRMAVLSRFRNQSVGRKILEELVSIAEKEQLLEVFLHAQIQAVMFYEKNGFHVEGEEFLEAGIPHLIMVKSLTTV